MAAFRILNQAPQYLLASGKVNAGGRLYFYETDLTTPKNTWSDPEMTVLNSNPVVMDSAGRTLTDVWGDGEYGVVMTNSLLVPIWTRNNVRADGDPALDLPELGEGEVWVGDGAGGVVTTTISQLPDMTGEAGNILFTDGVLAYWGALVIPEPVEPEIVITAAPTLSAFQAGVSDDETKFYMQLGTTSVPAASGAKTSTKDVTFTTPFATTPFVFPVNNTGFVTATGDIMPTVAITAVSTTGFTIRICTQVGESNGDANITSTTSMGWVAFGTREVAA